jgi:hypothetical protein
MGNFDPVYRKLLESMGVDYPLGEHQWGGYYIDFSGEVKGFNRICLYESENAPGNTFFSPNNTFSFPENTFSLVVVSGDTCKQARELYQHFSYEKAVALGKKGWTLENHFHLAWQRKNIIRTKGDKELSLSEYIGYWRRQLNQGNIRQYKKVEFDLLKKMLREAKIMNEDDIVAFDKFFREHKYQSAITCPGIVNWISFPKERLNEKTETLSAELREKTTSLIEIYNQNAI